jgi:hypothetical protein
LNILLSLVAAAAANMVVAVALAACSLALWPQFLGRLLQLQLALADMLAALQTLPAAPDQIASLEASHR